MAKITSKSQKIRQKKKVSVIIPARNEEEYVGGCIKSIQNQDFDSYEIIVVDNGSTDNTSAIAESLGAKVVYEGIPGLPRAREAGRKEAKGEILVYLDADMVIPPCYLSKIVTTLDKHPEILATSNPFSFYDSYFMLSFISTIFFKFYKLFCRFRLSKGVFGGNFAVRSETMEKIGGFDSSIEFFGEDANISKRILEKGKIAFMYNLCTKTSARRYRENGILKTGLTYMVNYISMGCFNKPFRFPEIQIPSLVRYAGLSLPVIAFLAYGLAYPSSTFLGKIMYKINSSGDKEVALTFDDGPNGKYTEEVLDTLDKEGIKATFFVVGKNAEFYPTVVKEISDRGNVIGNHSYSHPWKLPFENRRSILKEVNETDNIVYKICGKHTCLFRPPHGIRTPWMINTVKSEGYKVVTWDDMTIDYMSRAKAETIASSIVRRVRPGSIIVLHDGVNLKHDVNRDNSIKALSLIIKELKRENYKFVTLQPISQQI